MPISPCPVQGLSPSDSVLSRTWWAGAKQWPICWYEYERSVSVWSHPDDIPPWLGSRPGARSRSGRCHSHPECQYRPRHTSECAQRRMLIPASPVLPRQCGWSGKYKLKVMRFELQDISSLPHTLVKVPAVVHFLGRAWLVLLFLLVSRITDAQSQ